MAVPDKTTFITDLTVASLTAIGSPVKASDEFGTNNTYDFDGSDDRLTSTLTPIGNGVAKYTVAFWVKMAASAPTGTVVNQRNSVAGGSTYEIQIINAGSNVYHVNAAYRENGNTHFINLVTSGGTFPNASSQFNYITFTVDLTARQCDLFINGVEPTYTTHNNIGGTPASATLNVEYLGVGSVFNNSAVTLLKGIPSRLAFWNGTKLTSDHILEEFGIEKAKRDADQSFLSPIRPSILSPTRSKIRTFISFPIPK